MIIWGTGGEVIELGRTGTHHCETCERERPFNMILQYRYAHLYYLFAWVTSKHYFLVCEVCQRGWELDKKEVEATLEENPIPFHYRYGWSFLVGLVVLFIISASVEG